MSHRALWEQGFLSVFRSLLLLQCLEKCLVYVRISYCTLSSNAQVNFCALKWGNRMPLLFCISVNRLWSWRLSLGIGDGGVAGGGHWVSYPAALRRQNLPGFALVCSMLVLPESFYKFALEKKSLSFAGASMPYWQGLEEMILAFTSGNPPNISLFLKYLKCLVSGSV